MTAIFKIPASRDPREFGTPIYKRSWTRDELVAIFPDEPITVLDVGAGENPFKARKCDDVITADFSSAARPAVLVDLTREWPFEAERFDLIYASHVMEHLYPQDRDKLILKIFQSLRRGGLFFFRVPHKSSLQSTGWEHFTLFGTNGATSLTHGQNPNLPQFELLAVGLAMGDISRFYRSRSVVQKVTENLLNASFRLTDQFLSLVIGGVPEVQFLLRRP